MQEPVRLNKETLVVHDSHDERHYGAVSFPVYQNSLFTFKTHEELETALSLEVSSMIYTRGNNPTVALLEDKLAKLEGGEKARCFTSGMAAITAAILSVVRSGDHIICVDGAYGPTKKFLEQYLNRFHIQTSFVDGRDVLQIEAAVQANTRLIYLESPTSFTFELQDIRKCAALASRIGATTIIDNTWATPMFQNPLELGIDLVVHSMTKYISGHSDLIGGVVIGSQRHMDELFAGEFQLLGGILHPQSAAIFMRGLRTLPLRMNKHEQNGLRVAQHLRERPNIIRVNQPGLEDHPQHELFKSQMRGSSSVFSFETDIPMSAMRRWANALLLFRKGISWGGYESLVYMREWSDGTVIVRLYVGLEEPEDLMQDMEQAFESIGYRCAVKS
ncbi:trans-sulfuration enzyme family protein [Paenibacillus guangzhouensis]|uniref:trans-sulfuration enzyme family protein n=1 Tax=Paenibacillus guangzhouensis TaxID=1473112 RepID=UPI001266D1C4|nr:aminotransferase class I/II-fold pyridoxal phosphate-dependent enzyme [Paenibacillus guangzhouensis]